MVKINKGYVRKDTAEVTLYVPGILDDEGQLCEPIGGKKKPFIAIVRSRDSDEVKKASDRLRDEVTRWFQENEPKRRQKERNVNTLMNEQFEVWKELTLDWALDAIEGWINAPAEDEDGNPVDNPKYDPEAMREFLAEDTAHLAIVTGKQPT